MLNGGGTLVLSGNNTYSGGTTICGVDCTIPGASSTLRVGVDSVFNTPGDPSSGIVSSAIGTGTLTFDSGILQAGGNFTLANTAQINSIGGTIDANGFTFNYAGAIGDTAGHIGNLTITNSAGGAGVVVLSGNNTYTGGTLVSGGTVQVTNANSVGTGDVTLDNGKFQTDGLTDLTFINNFKVNTTGGTVDNNGTVLTLSGIISNGNGKTGVLQFTDTAGGFGTTVLSGVNTYSGGTKVVGAAVQVTNNNSVGTGTVTLEEALFLAEGVSDLTFANNFKLNTGANGSAIDANGVTLTISGVVSNGNGAGKLSILDSGGGGKVVFLGANTYTGDTTICACATLQLGDATHTSAISGKVFNEGYLDIVNANTSGLTSITNDGGETYFYNSTSASAATITNKFFGATFFLDSSTAGTATIKNEFGGITNFGMPGGTDTSTAGAANIENIGGGTIFAASTNAGTATINNHTGGGTIFVEQSSAQSAKITNSNFGFTLFGTPFGPDTVTAGNAEITNNADGLTSFNALSTAGNAKITTNDGGKTNFFDNSTGGNAQFITNGTGIVDFGGSIGPGSDGRITAGSIAGSGFYYIGGGNTLVTGSNNLSTTVSGVIADFDPCGCGMPGIGSLEKVGTGTMILSGTNTYTGTTTVIGGMLQVDGSTASSSQTTVKANAALTGIGTVGNTTIESGGILLPGSGVAGSSLNVAGNLAFQSGALYLVTLNSTTASFANVTGTADLAGQVGASVLAGSTVKSKYTILTAAGGRNGQFAGVDTLGLPGGLVASLSYDNNNAYLNFVLDYAAKYGLNINQTNVASALKNFFNANGGIPAAFTGLTPGGLSQISGETATGTQQATFTAMNLFLGLLTDPFIDGRGGGLGGTAGAVPFAESESMAYAAKKSGAARDAFAKFPTKAAVARNDLLDQRFSLWGSAYGGGANIERRSGLVLGSNNATARAFGFAAGADFRITPNTLAGFALSGGGTSFSVNGFGTGRSDMFQAGAFVRHNVGAAYFTGALAYGWQDVTTDRTVTVAGIERLRAQFQANSFAGRFEAGYRYATPVVAITPYAAGQFTTYYLPSYAEQVLAGPGNFALNYAGRDVTASRTELGVRLDRSFAMETAVVTLRGRLAWAHDFNTDRSITPVFQTLPGAAFIVNGARQAPNSALTTAAAEVKWINGWSAAAVFEGEFSDISRSYAGKGILRYAW